MRSQATVTGMLAPTAPHTHHSARPVPVPSRPVDWSAAWHVAAATSDALNHGNVRLTFPGVADDTAPSDDNVPMFTATTS